MTAEISDGGPSLELLYRQHFQWLVRVLRVRFGADGAEDLVQETYLRAASIQSLASIQSPRGLLLRIATNVAIDQRRRAAVRPSASGSVTWEVALERRGVAGDQSELLALKQIILSLPPKLREVFLLSRRPLLALGGRLFGDVTLHQFELNRLSRWVLGFDTRARVGRKGLAHAAWKTRL
jgi:RNA polymerase sigma-70 factor (ECF subfamily)